MGRGIAQVAAATGYRVLLADASLELAEKGKATIAGEPPAAEKGVGPTAGAGCGCAVPGRTDSEPYAAMLIALGIALARRRSRE